MASYSDRRPEFRLHFGYPYLTIRRCGAPPRQVALDAPGAAAELRAFGAEIDRAAGRLTAVLPEDEVWRAELPAGARSEDALRQAAAALHAAPKGIEVALGESGPGGARAAAAVRRETIDEARAFLAGFGLHPSAMTGAGTFPGFQAPPVFGAAAPAVLRRPVAAAALAGAAALVALSLAWRDGPPVVEVASSPPAPPAATDAEASPETAVAAETAVAPPRARPSDLAFAPAPPPVRAGSPAPILVGIAARDRPDDVPAAPRLDPAPAVRVAALDASPPRARPRASEASAPVALAPAIQAETAPTGPAPMPRPTGAGGEAAAAPIAATAAPVADAAVAPAGPRPEDGRPRARPAEIAGTPAVVPPAALAATLGAAIAAAEPRVDVPGGPRARPVAASTVMVASLDPTPALGLAAPAASSIAPPAPRRLAPAAKPAAAAKPEAQPAAAAKPAAQPAAAPKPAAQPVAVTPKPLAPKPTAQPAPAPVRAAAPAPTRPAAAAPARAAAPAAASVSRPAAAARPQQSVAPARQAKLAPTAVKPARAAAPAPAPAAAAPKQQQRQTVARAAPAASTERGVGRGDLALIGVFGSAGGRHALVQLSNGETERVRVGDEIRGVQVTAISADAIHLRSRGRDSVVKLPD